MTLTEDAVAIWQAGVNAVDSARLTSKSVSVDQNHITIGSDQISLNDLDRIQIVGAGKAGAGMVRGLLSSLQNLPARIHVDGWVNVPEDCVSDCEPIHLHAARPPGINEPTAAGVAGTQEILKRVSKLTNRHLCIVLISGGGSALLPAPIEGVTLKDKLAVIRLLAQNGATINELNIVRSQLSLVKGGGLLQHCGPAKVVTLIISDIIGDPVDLIASGPMHPSHHSAAEALNILTRFDPTNSLTPQSVMDHLKAETPASRAPVAKHSSYIIGSNQKAMTASAKEAKRRNFQVVERGSQNCGEARALGETLLKELQQLRDGLSRDSRPVCILAGGETTVQLTKTDQPQKGGRNQEMVLAAIASQPSAKDWANIALLSGGTDGEDGPTNAAGAIADEALVNDMNQQKISADEYLQINNSYPFFDQLNGLILTGPTHTNVMDLAVGVCRPGKQ